MTQKLDAYIDTRGQLVVLDTVLAKDPIEFTTKLLAFKAEIDKIVIESFDNNQAF